MPNYASNALKQFGHTKPSKPQHSPYPAATINYGAKKQYATEESTAPAVSAKKKKWIQQVVGNFLFYGRAFNSTLLCPLSAIAVQRGLSLASLVQMIDKERNGGLSSALRLFVLAELTQNSAGHTTDIKPLGH